MPYRFWGLLDSCLAAFEKQDYQCVDCTFGSFYRRFSLPVSADGTAIKAKSNQGVLEIVIPKKEALEIKPLNVTLEE